MAALKFLAFLCVAALATAALVPYDNPEIKNIIDDVLALLNQLKTIVEDAVASALATVGNLLDSVLSAVDTIVSGLRQTLEDTVANLIQQIDALEEEAAAAGVDAGICIGSSVADLTALPEPLLENVISCLDAKVQEAKAEISQTISDIQSVEETVVVYAERIVNCTTLSIIKEIVCIGGLTAEITASIVSVPLKITADVATLTQYISTLVTSLTSCEVGVVSDLIVAGGSIVANVTECVNDLLNH